MGPCSIALYMERGSPGGSQGGVSGGVLGGVYLGGVGGILSRGPKIPKNPKFHFVPTGRVIKYPPKCTPPGPPGGPPRRGGPRGPRSVSPQGGWYTPGGSLSPVSASELFPIHMPVRTGTSRPVVTARMPPAVGAPRPPNLSPPTRVLSAPLLTLRWTPRRSESVRRRGGDHVNSPVSHRWFPPLSSVGHWHRPPEGRVCPR